MLPKKFRLNIAFFYKSPQKAKRYSTVNLVLMMKKSTGQNRFAALAPKSLDKRSVYRNRTKRIILEVVQKKMSRYTCCADILLKSKKILKKEERPGIEKEIDELFRKAGILSNN